MDWTLASDAPYNLCAIQKGGAMRTPAGAECHFYYEDYNRGRNIQECRLLKHATGSGQWKPRDCSNCPVPEILWANASEYLELRAVVRTGFLGFDRHVEVMASCSKHHTIIQDPYTGCQECAKERPGFNALVGED